MEQNVQFNRLNTFFLQGLRSRKRRSHGITNRDSHGEAPSNVGQRRSTRKVSGHYNIFILWLKLLSSPQDVGHVIEKDKTLNSLYQPIGQLFFSSCDRSSYLIFTIFSNFEAYPSYL